MMMIESYTISIVIAVSRFRNILKINFVFYTKKKKEFI